MRHFLFPAFDHAGDWIEVDRPWNVIVFGKNIRVGNSVHFVTTKDQKIRLVSWANDDTQGSIEIGDACLLTPGIRISSIAKVTMGRGCMMAQNSYITDADWHDTYDRVAQGTKYAPVTLEDNVWIGDGAIVCKGVTIGENSIIGARSVVIDDIPANVIAAGNPAKVVKQLDPDHDRRTRMDLFANPSTHEKEMAEIDRVLRKGNSILGWIRVNLWPTPRD